MGRTLHVKSGNFGKKYGNNVRWGHGTRTSGEDWVHTVCMVRTLYKHLGRILNAQIGYLAPAKDIEYKMGTLNTKADLLHMVQTLFTRWWHCTVHQLRTLNIMWGHRTSREDILYHLRTLITRWGHCTMSILDKIVYCTVCIVYSTHISWGICYI